MPPGKFWIYYISSVYYHIALSDKCESSILPKGCCFSVPFGT